MTQEYLQKLAASEGHIKHVTLEIVASYLAGHASEVVEEAEQNLPLLDDESETADYELMGLFSEPLEKGIAMLAAELKHQAEGLVKQCMCYWLEDERAYPAIKALLRPLAASYSFGRHEDEGYRLEVSGELIYEHLEPDDAIEATRRYVEARQALLPPPDGLN